MYSYTTFDIQAAPANPRAKLLESVTYFTPKLSLVTM